LWTYLTNSSQPGGGGGEPLEFRRGGEEGADKEEKGGCTQACHGYEWEAQGVSSAGYSSSL